MPDGSKFVYENIQQNAEPTGDSIARKESRKGLSISSASNNSIPQNAEKATTSSKKLLENRVFGDDLLNAQDLISDVRGLGAEVDEHGYFDKNGWLHRNANVINAKNGNIYNLTVDIAKTEDGRVVLYATKGKIKKVGQAKVNSLKARGSTPHSNFDISIPQNTEKSTPSAQENFDKVRRSRTASGDVVTISEGELAKLHANYAGEKTFAKKDVVDALKGVEALKVLPAARRTEIANEIWKGYNQRLHQQGFEMFTELAWHELHAEVMQETSFEMSDDAIRAMDEQIVAALP